MIIPRPITAGIAMLALLSVAAPAESHRMWLLPSATVLSGEGPWITVDAAVSNDLFYFEHFPLRLEGLAVTGPDGSSVETANTATGRYRSTFDVQLTQSGTYKVAIVNDGVFARYTLDGERRRWRGTAERLASEIPAGAEGLEITQVQRRIEVFATLGAPTKTVLEPAGRGLELVPITHPNDLFAGEEAKFRLMLDGAPAVGLKVEIVPGGIRYRDRLGDWSVTTDAEGVIAVTWPGPGMYWINASHRDDRTTIERGTGRNAGYTATLEVLP